MSRIARFLVSCAATLLFTASASAQRQWTVTGRDVPELAAIDRMVQQQMLDFDIRGAEVAIAKDGRLVYARGFTWDDAGVKPVQPTTLFRTGSIAKAITSIAVHQLIERGLLGYDTPVAQTLGLQPLPGEQTDPRLAGVTLDHLLTHTSGLSSVDSVYQVDRLVAAAVGAGPPPTKREIISYIVGQPFVFDSGTAWDYNNYGYIMLDLLVEHATGVPYDEYVVENVFRKVGVGRARVAHQLASERVPTETDYDGLEGDDPYGLAIENAVAAGGWVMAAPDMARLFSALFDSDGADGLLERSTIADMLSLPFPASVGLGYGRGWIQEKMFTDSGHTMGWFTDPDDDLQVYGHGGGGTGVHTLAVWRSDGIVFVWFTNKDPIMPTIEFPEIASWPDHDLWESVGVSLDPVGSAPTESWIPIVASGRGVGDSVWRSDVGLLNRSPLSNRVRLRLYRPNGSLDREVELAPGEQRAFSDVMAEFGSTGSAPLRLFSSEPLTVGSRISAVTADGTFGQFLDSSVPTSSLSTGDSAVLMQLAENRARRTNIGLHNGWKRAADVSIALYDGDGSLVTTSDREIPPEQTVQLNRPFLELGGCSDIDSGYAVVTVRSGRHVLAYASVVDNATNDPTTIPMKAASGSDHQWVAAAAHGSGANGSEWRTDLGLLNRSGDSATAQIVLHSGNGGSSFTVTLADGEQLVLDDVVAQLGELGSGALEVAADRPLLVSSRTYNAGQSGTFGQFLDGVEPQGTAASGETVWLPHLRQDGSFRTNIGVVNTGAEDSGVTIRLSDAAGGELASRQYGLDPGGRLQLQEPFSRIAGRNDLESAYATVTVSSGDGVVAYASVIDNGTNDPTTIPMKR